MVFNNPYSQTTLPSYLGTDAFPGVNLRSHTEAFKQVFGYSILRAKDATTPSPLVGFTKRAEKNSFNTLRFLNLIPIIGLIANIVLIKLIESKTPDLKKLNCNHICIIANKLPHASAMLATFIISALGVGILLLPIQLIATAMKLNDRCKTASKEKTVKTEFDTF